MQIGKLYNERRPIEQREIAAICAKDYETEHDDWESAWPLEFALYETEDGPEVARLSVECDYEPVFSAIHVTKPEEGTPATH